MAIFRRGPLNGGVECRGYEKSRFSTNLGNDTRHYKTTVTTAMVTMECEYETVLRLSNVTIFNGLE